VPATILETPRLRLRELTPADDAFMLGLLNSPAFLRYIGDRNVRSLADAGRYLREGAIAAYARDGYGMYAVERRGDRLTVGVCGLVRRPGLDDADLGFAFLPEHCSLGYGSESAMAMLRHAREVLGLGRVVAIVVRDNAASIRLLERLGMVYERDVQLPHDPQPLMLYATP
jgi:RimJ/RimL family protein N-acetyltransferase